MPEPITVETQQGLIFCFDGEVLEVFSYDESRRVHVRQMRAIQLGGGILGGTSLSVALKVGSNYSVQCRVSEAEKAQLMQLVERVQSAIAQVA